MKNDDVNPWTMSIQKDDYHTNDDVNPWTNDVWTKSLEKCKTWKIKQCTSNQSAKEWHENATRPTNQQRNDVTKYIYQMSRRTMYTQSSQIWHSNATKQKSTIREKMKCMLRKQIKTRQTNQQRNDATNIPNAKATKYTQSSKIWHSNATKQTSTIREKMKCHEAW